MSTSEQRINRRVEASFEINYVHEGDYLISFSKDISADGMFIYTENPPAVGTTTRLSFAIDENRSPFNVAAKVIWVNTSGGSKDKGAGVQFMAPSKEIKEAVLKFVNRVAVVLE